MIPIALTIAGSDPSGGAGIQADLKTFHQLRVYGTSALTLVTVQNTVRVTRVHCLEPSLVRDQIEAVLEDLPPQGVKTGALGAAAIIDVIASIDFPCPLIVDPVTISKHGARLIDSGACESLRKALLPRAALVTPNLDEAAELAGMQVDSPETMRQAAVRIAEMGPAAVLVKGGHLQHPEGDVQALDILYHNGQFTDFSSPRIATRHTHGTGCTYSAAITAFLARGRNLVQAIGDAKAFVTAAIGTAPGLGAGAGPLNHWVSL